MNILLYVAIGLTVGVVSGTLGIGGGVLLVPALIWLCRFHPARAAGTSLAVLVPPIGLPAAWKAFGENRVDLEAAVWLAVAFMIGAYLGACIDTYKYELALRFLFGLLMIYIGMRFILGSSSEAGYAAAGLTAVLLAWLGNLGLRSLGRRHLATPDLGGQIRSMKEQGRGDTEYHI